MATIGIDAGTSGCKAVLLAASGRVQHTAWAGYRTDRRLDGSVSQHADDWLRAVITTTRSCAEAADESVEALSITAPAHNVVLIGESGRPLRRVMLWSDPRPSRSAEAIRRQLGDAFLIDRTLVSLTAGWSLPQLAWLSQNEDGLLERVRLVLPAKDYLRYRLTREVATDPSDATGTAMFDPRRAAWVPELVELAGLRAEQLPPVVPPLSLGGTLSRTASRWLGLPTGTPVAVGGTDTAAELLAAGVADPGQALVKIASTGTVVAISREPRAHPHLLTYPHVLADRWYTLAATNSAATAYAWLRDIIHAEPELQPEAVYAEMDRAALRIAAGAGGLLFLPFLAGERTPYWDSQLRGAFFGLSAAHRRGHLCRSVLEGVALSLRACRDEVRDAGFELDAIHLAGGGTASRLWRRILASVMNVDARVASAAGPALGAALTAAVAVRGAEAMGTRPRFGRVKPVAAWVPKYDDLFETYQQAAAMAAPVSHRLSATQSAPGGREG